MGNRIGVPRWAVAALALVVVTSGCSRSPSPTQESRARSGGIPAEPRAGTWKTWVLTSPAQITVPPPPAKGSSAAKAERAEVTRLAAKRTARTIDQAHHWGDYPATEPWTKENMALVAQQSKNPPLASRGYGLVSVAVHDAVVATWHWKYVYRRDPPDPAHAVVPVGADPSYPSEHAAIAGAASRLLAYLFPERTEASYDAEAEEAAESRVAGGTNYRSDVEAGLTLGRAVAEKVIARARADGSDAHWDGRRPPAGPQSWAPPPGTPPEKTQPVEPLAGTWRTWVADLAQLRPGPPPTYGSPQFVAETREVMDVGNALSEEQKRIAKFWAGGAGTPLPPGIWNQIALDQVRSRRLTTPAVARIFALVNVAQSDAGEAAWDCKYAYWSPRPVNAIHDLGLDPNWKSFLPTPVFPSYISGHSTYSAAAAEVLADVFPSQAERFRAMAREAALSRLYGGIHFRSDNDTGLVVGTEVGKRVVERAHHDGAA